MDQFKVVNDWNRFEKNLRSELGDDYIKFNISKGVPRNPDGVLERHGDCEKYVKALIQKSKPKLADNKNRTRL